MANREERGVLGRLAAAAACGHANPPSLEDSVLEHLRALLNSRAMGAEARPSYGVPDFVDYLHNFPGGLRELKLAIQRTIVEHEPRLSAVSVRPVQVPGAEPVLRFEIVATLAEHPGRPRLRFNTRIEHGGHVVVE